MKRNLIKLLSVMVLVTAIVSCSSDETKIKQVSEKYLRAYRSLNFEEAKKCVTPESAKMIDLLNAFTVVPDVAKQVAIIKAEKMSIQFTKIEIKNNEATANCLLVISKDEKEEETLYLKKVDGKCLVHQPKENSASLDGDAEEEPATTEGVANSDSNAAKTLTPAHKNK